MKAIMYMILLAGAAVVGYMVYASNGAISGDSVLDVLKNAWGLGAEGAGKAVDAGRPTMEELANQPWFWSAVIITGLTAITVRTWNRMDGWLKGLVLVITTIGITVVVTTYR